MNTPPLRWIDRERDWCLRANRWGARVAVRAVFAIASRLGDGVAWYALTAAFVLAGGERGLRAAADMAAVGITAALLYRGLKRWTRRPRPCSVDARIRAWITPLDEFSFPSGHTLHAVSFTLVALAWYPWLAPVLVPFAVLVAASRVVLGVHYPSDVLAATAIGAALASGWLWLSGGLPGPA
jgi:undecaprenyl-diphosphatase